MQQTARSTVFSSQNAFAALDTKKAKKKKGNKDKDDKSKKDKGKSTDNQNGHGASGSAGLPATENGFGPPPEIDWADEDSDDGFAPPTANWMQVCCASRCDLPGACELRRTCLAVSAFPLSVNARTPPGAWVVQHAQQYSEQLHWDAQL